MIHINRQLFLLVLLATALIVQAQPYSFESAEVPSIFTTINGGTLSTSTLKSKLGTQSLRWDWVKGSYLRINTPTNLAAASTQTAGGITLFIYNPQATNTALSFQFYNKNNTLRCQKSFNLNFNGWRTFWNRFSEDMKHNKTELTQLRIYPPNKGESGTLFFDLLEFPSSIPWSRMSDAQYTVSQSPSMEPFWNLFQHTLPTNVIPTLQEIEATEQITKRTDQWFLGANTHSSTPEYQGRLNRINSWINTANNNYPKLGLTRNTDGTVKGEGLFMTDYTSKIENMQPQLFRNIGTNYMLQLAYDYRLHASSTAAERLNTLYDWFYDQGWAAGSAHGSLYFEKLRSGGYFNSLFLMRNSLGKERLTRELETLRWYTLFGTALSISEVGETADNLRTLLTPKLFYALMQPTATERVAALRSFRDYCVYAFTPNSGYFGTFKNDGLGGHHNGIYLGAYLPDALYTAAQVAYLLHNTPFALPQTTVLSLKKSLLAYTDFCALYDVPTATNGRFTGSTTTLHTLLFAFPYVAIALGGDDDLVKAMRRLWHPTETPIKGVIESAGISITYTASLGEIGAALDALTLTQEKEQKRVSSHFYPFGALGVYRTEEAHVSIKSASCYVWDFESGGPTENPYGRNLGNGVVETTHTASQRKNPSFPLSKDATLTALFRWSRLSGATTIDLSNKALNYASSGSIHRNFTDQSFAGGTSLNDTLALYALSFHDQTFNPSFYFQKSHLRIGDAFLCQGTNIRNTDTTTSTITTLFQTELLANETVLVNGTPCSFDGELLTNPTLTDNLGSVYIVLSGNVRLNSSSSNGRTLVSAYIDHGKSPSDASYRYLFIPSASKTNTNKWNTHAALPFVINQSDNKAHIINIPTDRITAYTLFSNTFIAKEGIIRSVSSPSIILTHEYENGNYHISLSDPNLRRAYANNISNLTNDDERRQCEPYQYSCSLNGLFFAISLPPGFALNYSNGLTIITGTVREGNSYHMTLNANSSINEKIKGDSSFSLHYQNHLLTVDYHNLRPYTVSVINSAGALLHQTGPLSGKADIPLNLSRGIYIICLYDSTGTYTRKYIVNS